MHLHCPRQRHWQPDYWTSDLHESSLTGYYYYNYNNNNNNNYYYYYYC